MDIFDIRNIISITRFDILNYFEFKNTNNLKNSTLASKGMPITMLKEIAGHNSIETTERYVHVSDDTKQRAYKQYFYQ